MVELVCNDNEITTKAIFRTFLLRVGEGTESENESNMIHLDSKYIVRGQTIADLADTIYADIKVKYDDGDYRIE